MKWTRRIIAGLGLAIALAAPVIPLPKWHTTPVEMAGCDDYECGPISTWST